MHGFILSRNFLSNGTLLIFGTLFLMELSWIAEQELKLYSAHLLVNTAKVNVPLGVLGLVCKITSASKYIRVCDQSWPDNFPGCKEQ